MRVPDVHVNRADTLARFDRVARLIQTARTLYGSTRPKTPRRCAAFGLSRLTRTSVQERRYFVAETIAQYGIMRRAPRAPRHAALVVVGAV